METLLNDYVNDSCIFITFDCERVYWMKLMLKWMKLLNYVWKILIALKGCEREKLLL